MKNLLSKLKGMWKDLDIKERLLDIKTWIMGHLECFTFWKGLVLVSAAAVLQLGVLCPMTVLKLGLLSWGAILLLKHHSDHYH
tara:strand:+ start:6253 stop:6501 length:249 start_codon:yes stop_codon:yes gene_type:complete